MLQPALPPGFVLDGQGPAASAGIVPGTRPPPQRAPQTPAEQRRDELGVTRAEQEIQQAPLQQQSTQANIRQTEQTTAQNNTRGVNFSDENSLRTQFNGSQSVQRYLQTLPPYIAAMTAGDNRAGDLNLVYGFASIMDPGSVVREGEQLMVRGTGAIADRAQGALSLITRTGQLTPEVRAELRAELRRRGQVIGTEYRNERGRYEQLAHRYGFEPEAIVGPLPSLAIRRELGIDVPEEGRSPPGTRDSLAFGGFDDNDQLIVNVTGGHPARNLEEASPELRAMYAQAKRNLPGLTFEQFMTTLSENAPRPDATTNADEQLREIERERGAGGVDDLLHHGATFGLSDEVSGVSSAIRNAVTAPFMEGRDFDPVGAYRAGNRAEDMFLDRARDRTGAVGTGAEILGNFAGGRPSLGPLGAGPGGRTVWDAPIPNSLAGRMSQGARIGGGTGALVGFGYGEGTQNSLLGAGAGAVGGGAIGAAIPAAGAGLNALLDVGRTATGNNPNLVRTTIARAISNDANTPAGIGSRMTEAQADGVPYMLADSGDNARGLLAASARAPGRGRTLARDALDERQGGLGERVTGAIERDLGPASNPHQVAEDLMTRARTDAAPLYDQFYAAPGADEFAGRIASLMNRPAMRQAMARAVRIAQEEGRDPRQLGFAFDAEGNAILNSAPVAEAGALEAARAELNAAQNALRRSRSVSGRGDGDVSGARDRLLSAREAVRRAEAALNGAPAAGTRQQARVNSWQTWDYIKRGLDDVMNSQPRDPATGRIILDEGTKAIEATRRGFLAAADRANPHWAPARAAWAGPVQSREAMDLGRRALNMTADDLTARTARMGDNERQFFALGVRRAMAERIANTGDTGNVVHALIGTGRKRAFLQRLFGGRQGFDRFVRTLQAEQEGFQTYRTARLGSPTAPNMQDDAALANAVTAGVTDMATSGLPIVSTIRQAVRYGTGEAGRKAMEQISAILSEANPTRLSELARELGREAAKLRRGRARAGRRSTAYGQGSGVVAGRGAAAATDDR